MTHLSRLATVGCAMLTLCLASSSAAPLPTSGEAGTESVTQPIQYILTVRNMSPLVVLASETWVEYTDLGFAGVLKSSNVVEELITPDTTLTLTTGLIRLPDSYRVDPTSVRVSGDFLNPQKLHYSNSITYGGDLPPMGIGVITWTAIPTIQPTE